MSWYVAPSLNQLLAEVNSRWPNRDKASDGSIGDAAHSSRLSDHNPDAGGVVRARDFDVDGIDVSALINAAINDPRTKYVIHNRQIWQSPALYRNPGWQPYTGKNPHTQHVHVSIRATAEAANNTAPWFSTANPVIPIEPIEEPTTPEDTDMIGKFFSAKVSTGYPGGLIVMITGRGVHKVTPSEWSTAGNLGYDRTLVWPDMDEAPFNRMVALFGGFEQ